jgi:glutamine synthetase
MVGSAQSIAGPNVALNTIAAEALDEIATRLENADNKNTEAQAIIKEIYKKHGRIIFNGNNYSDEWIKEAEKRGLPNVKNSVDALKAFSTDKALKLFEKHDIFTHKELHSRYEIYVEHYSKQVNIEALAAIDMVKKQFIPAALEYATFLADSVMSFNAVSLTPTVQENLLKKINILMTSSYKNLSRLESTLAKTQGINDVVKKAETYRDEVVAVIQLLRKDIDSLESIVPRDMWPVPTYTDLLFKL